MNLHGKHILVVSSVYPLTFTTDRYGSFVHETVLRLQPTGAKFTVFAPAFKGSKHQTLEGIKVHRFRYCPQRFENLTHGEGAPTKVQNPFYLLVAACYILCGTWQLFWLCCREKPDLLHIHWPFPHGLMALPASKILKIPMVYSFHGAELLLVHKFKFVADVIRWLLPQAKSVTANSSFTKGLIGKLHNRKVSIVPYGLTIEAKQPKPRPLGEPPRLLFAGRLIERKGLTYLLQALPMILAERSVRLRIVGTGIEAAELKSQCEALGLNAVVDFLGFVSNEELVEEYACCDIFVLPAIVDRKGDTEGLGIVMIEALAHAKPVVASHVGGIVDAIRSGITGILVPEKDPQALASAILALLSDPERAASMGRKGLEDVQIRFGWTRIVSLWQNVFAEALDASSTFNDLSIAQER